MASYLLWAKCDAGSVLCSPLSLCSQAAGLGLLPMPQDSAAHFSPAESSLPFRLFLSPTPPPAETIKEQSCAGPLCQKCTPYRIVCLGWCWLNSCLWRLYFQLLSTLESSWLFSHFHWGIAGHFYHQLLPSFIHYLPYPCNHPFGHSIRHYPAYLSQPYTLSSEIHWKW